MDAVSLREWDNAHVWHPFTQMQSYREESAPIIVAAEGFELIDTLGRRYLDGTSSLWCNVHGHRVPEIDAAIRAQLDRVAHSTLLGLSNPPSSELAYELVQATPAGLNHVFYSDSGATAVEIALKIAYQYHRQARGRLGASEASRSERLVFVSVGGAYHGDTIGSVSVGGIEAFHHVFRDLLFETIRVPSPVTFRTPSGFDADSYRAHCFAEVERVLKEHHERIAGFVIEPLVQGAAGILVHPRGYLQHVRQATARYGIPLIADEVAVGFGRTGTMFACEQESVTPDLLCLAKGLTGGYLPLAATLATDDIFDAFLGDPAEGRTFFHGHTYTGNPLGCAAALASMRLLKDRDVLQNVARNAARLADRLRDIAPHRHVGDIRQKGIMVGIELVADRETRNAFPAEQRRGHQVTLAARERGVIVRPLRDVVVLMPAPAMTEPLIDRLCDVVFESIDSATHDAAPG